MIKDRTFNKGLHLKPLENMSTCPKIDEVSENSITDKSSTNRNDKVD